MSSLYSRIAVVFAVVLLAFGMTLAWLSYRAAKEHQHEVMQQLSRELAQHIAEEVTLFDANGLNRQTIGDLFRMARIVNPTIEFYLLDAQGLILAHSPPDTGLALERVSLAPVRSFLAGGALPILGDSPRSAQRQEVFSAAEVRRDGRITGYLYVVLVGDMYQQQAQEASLGHVLRTTAWTGVAALALALCVGLAAFAFITRRLNRLTRSVQAFENNHLSDRPAFLPASKNGEDEIGRLARAFEHLTGRLASHMQELKRQDQLRRELVANLSHDLRTPLTSMQHHLETLARLGDALSPSDRHQYLDVAVRQSHRVGRLAQQLFELARLECEETLPQPELFCLSELVQDIAQKFTLSAEDRGVRLSAQSDPQGLFVMGDIGLIERVITNLLENAIRHTPQGGEIWLQAAPAAQRVEVRVADTGTGIAAEHIASLFERDSPLRPTPSAGLGLLIAKRILELHGSAMTVVSKPGRGTVFSFALPAGEPAF